MEGGGGDGGGVCDEAEEKELNEVPKGTCRDSGDDGDGGGEETCISCTWDSGVDVTMLIVEPRGGRSSENSTSSL